MNKITYLRGIQMKKFLMLFLFVLLLLSVKDSAATTHLYFWVNDDTAHVLTQGDVLAWDTDVQTPGSTVIAEFYLDLDASKTITGADLLLQQFEIRDGEVKQGEPSDSSTVPDGIIYLRFGPFGFAAGNYVLRVVDTDQSSATSWFTINAMSSPAAHITGKIYIEGTPAPNAIYENTMINAFGQGLFSGFTDNQGNYTINLPTVDSTWRIEILFAPKLINYIQETPTYELQVPASGADSVDFYFTLPSSWIYGDIRDQSGELVEISGWMGWTNTTTNEKGDNQFQGGQFKLPVTVTPQGQDSTNYFYLDINDEIFFPGYLAPQLHQDAFPVSFGDSVEKNIVVYTTNSLIYGYVYLESGPPAQSYQIMANNDVGYTRAVSNAENGYFELHVRTGNSYYVGINTDPQWGTPLPEGYVINGGDWQQYQPGDTVRMNLVLASAVIDGQKIVPQKMYLNQNYPNPFNPSTQIEYGLAEAGQVKLTVYNILGQVMTVLVDSRQNAGIHRITWQPAQLAAGVYLYRLETAEGQFMKKLVLLK
jgi:hypothetical protein